jgi:hypothetical protein
MLLQCSGCRTTFSSNEDYCPKCGAGATTANPFSGDAGSVQPAQSYQPQPAQQNAPAPVQYGAPAPMQYSAPAPAPVQYNAPAPVQYNAPAPVQYAAPPQHGAAPVQYAGQPGLPGEEAILVPVSTLKLVVMFFFSFGLYQLYWVWSSWDYLRWRRNLKCLAFTRAWFNVIWFYPLMKEIKRIGQEVTPQTAFDEAKVGVGFIVISVFSFLLSMIPLIGGLFYFFFHMCLLACIISANNYVCQINRAAGKAHLIDSRFTVWNYVIIAGWLLLIVLSIVLALFGAFSKMHSS